MTGTTAVDIDERRGRLGGYEAKYVGESDIEVKDDGR